MDLFHGETHSGTGAFAADLGNDVLELLPVLATLDGLEVGADELDVVLGEDALVVQIHCGVERGLPAQRREHGVDGISGVTLGLDHLLHVGGGDGLDVGRVGELRIGHDRRGIGIDQAHPQAFGLEDPAGLCARIVELGGLTDDDRSGSDDQDVLEVGTAGHQARAPCSRETNFSKRYAASWGPAAASG